MTNIDAPDHQRAVVAASQLLAALGGTTATVTVTLAPNVEALWIFGEGVIDPPPLVTGVDSGFQYPTFWTPWASQPALEWFSVVAIVAPSNDSAVVIHWPSPPANHWWVVADTGGRFTLDAALSGTIQTPGASVPSTAVLIGGSDGTDLRALLTDNLGRLVTSGGTFPAVFGVPGAANPADALQVGGSDGTDLRTLLTDVTGHLLTFDQNLKNTIAALNAALPPDAVLVGGSDGTDIRALLTDFAGRQLTIDQNLKLVVGIPASAIPSDALLTGGSDGVNLRAFRTDQEGMQYVIDAPPDTVTGDHPPNELQISSLNGNTNGAAVVAAPGVGKRIRVFYAALQAALTGAGNSAIFLRDNTPSRIIASAGASTTAASNMEVSGRPSGIPMTTNSSLIVDNSVAGGFYTAVVVYTTETV